MRRGQATVEYVLSLAVLIAALGAIWLAPRLFGSLQTVYVSIVQQVGDDALPVRKGARP